MDDLTNEPNALETPAPLVEAPALPEDPTTVDPVAVALAIEPTEGFLFTIGGKSFALTYLTINGQNAFDKLLKPWLGAGEHMSPAEMLVALSNSVVPIAALILSEQDAEATAAWLGSVREKGLRMKLIHLIMAQMELDEVGKFFAVLSSIGAGLRQAAR